jgi:hypothetical protein
MWSSVRSGCAELAVHHLSAPLSVGGDAAPLSVGGDHLPAGHSDASTSQVVMITDASSPILPSHFIVFTVRDVRARRVAGGAIHGTALRCT